MKPSSQQLFEKSIDTISLYNYAATNNSSEEDYSRGEHAKFRQLNAPSDTANHLFSVTLSLNFMN